MAFESFGLENIKIHVPEGGFFGQLNKLLGIGCSSEQSSCEHDKVTTEVSLISKQASNNGTQVDKSTKARKLVSPVRNVNDDISAQRALEEDHPIFKERGILKMKRTKKTYFPSLIE
ncbi:hypothetical protein HELRODRAFT_177671 [Helobdella robusta]|uniref:Uncharacterized protein n=1 Tax=Helobdella robusta TaxID=6412 RepID=T1FC18_HELRO|nr:hypothetical protein HELRODRAFT_177671 [Helobdella robusta]ESN97998.1 hypothetical protein HELRODRAFT_177671 [Helobdella robusta]